MADLAIRDSQFARYSQKMAALAHIRADRPVPAVAASPPTLSISAGTTSSITSGQTRAVNTSYVGWVGSTLTESPSYSGFFSGRRALGKVRVMCATDKLEFRLKRLGATAAFALLVDGELVFDGAHGEAVTGLGENSDQWLLLNFGTDAVTYKAARVAIVSGGSGYAVNDQITISGGTSTVAAKVRVTSVSGGVVNGVEILERGTYTAYPANNAASTGGTGSGATFSLQWEQVHSVIKPRRVELVLSDGCYCASVRTPVTHTLQKWPPSPAAPKMMIVGDSFTGPGSYGVNPAKNWAWLLAYRLGLEGNLSIDGVSGSGYTAVNSQQALLARVPDIISEAPDIVGIALGANDESAVVNTTTLQNAVRDSINAIHAGLPNCIVVAQTGWYGGFGSYRDAVINGIAAVSDQRRVRSINLFTQEIYTATTGGHTNGRADIFQTLPANVHPGQSGMDYLAAMLAPQYAENISSMALNMMASA